MTKGKVNTKVKNLSIECTDKKELNFMISLIEY